MKDTCTRAQFLKGAACAGIFSATALAGCSSAAPAKTDAAPEAAAPELRITSTIYGCADTDNKSTLKKTLVKTEGPGDIDIYHYDGTGTRVAYPEGTSVELEPVTFTGQALLNLGEGLDDSKIDSSAAVVEIAPGDGYLPEELVLSKTTLDGSWSDGKLVYTLDPGDISWNMDGYPLADENSGREWSCFGGDGNGCYTFNLRVSGLKYGGAAVSPATFPVQVYIWGRDATDMAQRYNALSDPVAAEAPSGTAPTQDVQWIWSGAGTMPVLCDQQADNFYAVWPEGSDASGISAADVSVTLSSQYGATLKLSEDDYTVFSSAAETQICVTYVNWPATPVYTQMRIEIAWAGYEASHTFEIASVYAYEVQQGGGGVTVDGTVVAYSFYGLGTIDDASKLTEPAGYVLATQKDGADMYYAEDSAGTPKLVSDRSEALVFDATGEDECNQQLLGNTVYVTTRIRDPEEHEVSGETLSFTRIYSSNLVKPASELAKEDLPLAAGFALGDDLAAHAMWSWQERFRSGYTPDKPRPTSFPYTTFPYGY